MSEEPIVCSLCKTPMKRYLSKKMEIEDKKLAKALGVRVTKGHLACPVHYQLKDGEYWLNYKRTHYFR